MRGEEGIKLHCTACVTPSFDEATGSCSNTQAAHIAVYGSEYSHFDQGASDSSLK